MTTRSQLRDQIIGVIGLFGADTGPLPAADLRAAQALANMAPIGPAPARADKT